MFWTLISHEVTMLVGLLVGWYFGKKGIVGVQSDVAFIKDEIKKLTQPAVPTPTPAPVPEPTPTPAT